MSTTGNTAQIIRSLLDDLERKQECHDTGAMAKIVEKDENGGYVVPDRDVPGMFFNETEESAAEIGAYIFAVGQSSHIEDYGGSLLRQYAEVADGRFDLGRVAEWETRYRVALSALPGLRAKIANMKRTQEALQEAERVRAAAKAQRAALMQGPAGLFIKHDPASAVRHLFEYSDTKAAMIEVVRELQGDTPSMDGLRKGVIDFITPMATAGTYVAFFDQNETALAELFALDKMVTFRAVREDIVRARRSFEVPAPEQLPRRGFFSRFKR